MMWRVVGAVALALSCGCECTPGPLFGLSAGTGGDEDVLEHGIVELHLLPSAAAETNPYAGTVAIEITMFYDECLTAYYNANPDAQMDGRDGESVFGGEDLGGEGWRDRLCEAPVVGFIDCEVTSFEQELNDMSKFLTVRFAVTGDLVNRIAPFGPLPTGETAWCEGSDQPLVRFMSPSNVQGFDANGAILWHAETFSPSEAVTDQESAIEIRAAPP